MLMNNDNAQKVNFHAAGAGGAAGYVGGPWPNGRLIPSPAPTRLRLCPVYLKMRKYDAFAYTLYAGFT